MGWIRGGWWWWKGRIGSGGQAVEGGVDGSRLGGGEAECMEEGVEKNSR